MRASAEHLRMQRDERRLKRHGFLRGQKWCPLKLGGHHGLRRLRQEDVLGGYGKWAIGVPSGAVVWPTFAGTSAGSGVPDHYISIWMRKWSIPVM